MNAAIAQLNVRTADARVGQRRADLLPSISGNAAYTNQKLNLEEFGLPGVTGVTDPFNIYRLQLKASQTIFDASAIGRVRAARDTAVAAGLDARAAGELAGATAGFAYLQALSARETVRAREADSTIAATLLDQARQLVGAGVSPAIDQTRSEVSFASVGSSSSWRGTRRTGPASISCARSTCPPVPGSSWPTLSAPARWTCRSIRIQPPDSRVSIGPSSQRSGRGRRRPTVRWEPFAPSTCRASA